MTPRRLSSIAPVAGALGALLGTGVVLAVAWATSFVACLDWIGTDACPRQGLANVQLIVAGTAVIPVFTLVYGLWAGRTRLAWCALAATVAVLAVWALLNDAAVHGWDQLRLVPGVFAF